MAKSKLNEYGLEFSSLAFLGGVFLTLIGVYGIVYLSDGPVSLLNGIADAIGNWKWWASIGGMFLAGIGGWYMFDFLVSMRKFNELIDTDSKHQLVKHLQELDELAMKLTTSHEIRLARKKEKLKIRK